MLERKHGLDDGAEFRALGGISSGEVFIAGEHAVGETVVFIERGEHGVDAFAIGGLAGDEPPDGPALIAWPLFTPCVESARSPRP